MSSEPRRSSSTRRSSSYPALRQSAEVAERSGGGEERRSPTEDLFGCVLDYLDRVEEAQSLLRRNIEDLRADYGAAWPENRAGRDPLSLLRSRSAGELEGRSEDGEGVGDAWAIGSAAASATAGQDSGESLGEGGSFPTDARDALDELLAWYGTKRSRTADATDDSAPDAGPPAPPPEPVPEAVDDQRPEPLDAASVWSPGSMEDEADAFAPGAEPAWEAPAAEPPLFHAPSQDVPAASAAEAPVFPAPPEYTPAVPAAPAAGEQAREPDLDALLTSELGSPAGRIGGDVERDDATAAHGTPVVPEMPLAEAPLSETPAGGEPSSEVAGPPADLDLDVLLSSELGCEPLPTTEEQAASPAHTGGGTDDLDSLLAAELGAPGQPDAASVADEAASAVAPGGDLASPVRPGTADDVVAPLVSSADDVASPVPGTADDGASPGTSGKGAFAALGAELAAMRAEPPRGPAAAPATPGDDASPLQEGSSAWTSGAGMAGPGTEESSIDAASLAEDGRSEDFFRASDDFFVRSSRFGRRRWRW